MLTRLKVTGFKNLVDVDVRFGPFTCIAGANGTGKSNLFDAIHFLSALADHPLIEAAKSVRDESGRTTDVRSLFHRVGNDYADKMSFEAEMIVPREGTDDLGQRAEATITFLRYSLALAFRKEEDPGTPGALELIKEELAPIKVGDAPKHLLFCPPKGQWRRSTVQGQRGTLFISTHEDGPKRLIKLHQDLGTAGRAVERSAESLPRTVLSVVTAAESPTALLARKEMRSWQLLQLEPSSLRKPDDFTDPTRLGMNGSHLAATLFRLARSKTTDTNHMASEGQESTYACVANRLAELIDDVRNVTINRDDKRELYTLQVTERDGTSHPARALSDGTLRFLALAVIALDPEAQGLLCLEEPENGIHPERIPAMLRLLTSIATDVNEPPGPDNPLRQVIINTHSPLVVGEVPEESLLYAELKEKANSGRVFKRVCFSCLPGTWRTKASELVSTVSLGEIVRYLGPLTPTGLTEQPAQKTTKKAESTRPRRVIDRADVQGWLIPDAAK